MSEREAVVTRLAALKEAIERTGGHVAPDMAAGIVEGAIALIDEEQPRVLTRSEFLASEAGTGWLESRWTPETGDGEPAETDIERCAWAGDTIAYPSGSVGTKDMLGDNDRVWSGFRAPTDEEREAEPW